MLKPTAHLKCHQPRWSSPSRPSSEQLQLATTVLLTFCLLAFIGHYIAVEYLGWRYPLSSPFFSPADRPPKVSDSPTLLHYFGDLHPLWQWAQTRDPYGGVGLFVSNYFPLANAIFFPFAHWTYSQLVGAYLLVCGVGSTLLVREYLRPLELGPRSQLRHSLVLGLLSYPFLFAVDRGNIEPLVYLATGAFLILERRDKNYPAVAALAFAASCKAYPALFILLLVRRKKWWPLLAFFVFCVVFTCGSLLTYMDPPLKTVMGLLGAMEHYRKVAGEGLQAFQHNSSFMAGLFALSKSGAPSWESLGRTLIEHYSWLGLACLGFVTLSVVFLRQLTRWQQILLISVGIVNSAGVSFDYKGLVYLFPLLECLSKGEEDDKLRSNFYIVLLSLLVVPKNFYFEGDIALGSGVFNSLLLPLVLVPTIFEALEDQPDGRGSKPFLRFGWTARFRR